MGSGLGHGAHLGAGQHGAVGSLPGLTAHLHRGTCLEWRGAPDDRPDGVFGEAGPLRRAIGFDALLAIEAGSMAQRRGHMEKMDAAPR